jgi:hypothetical protein
MHSYLTAIQLTIITTIHITILVSYESNQPTIISSYEEISATW